MPNPADSPHLLRFAQFELDLRTAEIFKEGKRIKLQEQPCQVLVLLLEHPGELVTREELRKKLWPNDTFVDFDHGVNIAINKLRDALGDSAENPRFIETLPRRGYRSVGSVHSGTTAAAPQEAAASATFTETSAPEAHRKGFVLALVLGAAVIAAFVVVVGFNTAGMRDRLLGKSAAPRIQSLAVLPLQNLSSDPSQEYFSDGMTDALITDLAQIGSLKVISRTSSMQYKQTKKSLPEIARELNVDGIIEGTVQRSGDRVRITAQLIHGPSDKHVWASSYERDMRDVFALERDVTRDIAHQVQARLNTQAEMPLVQPRPVNPKALEAYLQGNYHLNSFGKGFGDEEKGKAAEYFQQAITADPNFAAPYNGLAIAHIDLLWPTNQDTVIARSAAERAVELDPNSPDARAILGDIRIRTWDFPGAEEQFRRALALSPSNADAHDGFSYWLGAMGRSDESLHEAQIAQQLNPAGNVLPMALYYAHDYDRSIAVSLALIQSDPNDGYLHWDLSRTYAAKGMYKDSAAELEKTLSLFGAPETAARIHHAFLISGYRGARQQYAKELESLIATKQAYHPVELAEVYTTLGDKDRAFHWLEEAYKHREMHWAALDYRLEWINEEPLLDPLRSDPRFAELVHKVGLPQ